MPSPVPTLETSHRRIAAARADALASAAGLLRNFTDSFESGRRTRLNSRPFPQGGSSDAHLDWTTRKNQRNACQALLRNSTVARALVQRLCDLVIGDGFSCQALTKNTEWNAEAERLWSEWAVNHADVRGMRSLWQIVHDVMKALHTDGDMLVVKVAPDNNDEQPCVQLIESERIGSMIPTSRARAKKSETVFDGVQMDEYGRPVKFHLADWTTTGGTPTARETRTIDAADVLFLVNPRGVLVNNTRGEPGLQAVLDPIERLDEYIESVAIAARIATLLSLIIKTDNPAATQSALAEQAESVTGNVPTATDPAEAFLAPGSFFSLKRGESVEQVKPEQPTTNHQQFVLLQIQLIAADLGLPMILSHLDFSAVNFHSAKSAINVAYRGFETWQRFLADRLLVPLYRWRMRLAIERGEIADNDEFDRVEMIGPPPPSIDLEKEVQGHKAAVEANFMTQKHAISRLTGLDRDAVFAERSYEKSEERRLSIVPPSTPGSMTPTPDAPTAAPAIE